MSKNQNQHAVHKPTGGAKGSIVFKGGVARYQAPDAPILPPPPSEAITEVAEQMPGHIPRAHSQSSRKVDPNREYKIKRAALGDNPSKEEMDAVVTYGLAQHRKNFPHLYY